jgi:hypothetical protein
LHILSCFECENNNTNLTERPLYFLTSNRITQIDNIEILADPVNAMSLLKPVVNGNSHFVAASTAAAQTTTDVNRPSVRGELTNSTSTSRVSNSNSDESEFRYSRSVVGELWSMVRVKVTLLYDKKQKFSLEKCILSLKMSQLALI